MKKPLSTPNFFHFFIVAVVIGRIFDFSNHTKIIMYSSVLVIALIVTYITYGKEQLKTSVLKILTLLAFATSIAMIVMIDINTMAKLGFNVLIVSLFWVVFYWFYGKASLLKNIPNIASMIVFGATIIILEPYNLNFFISVLVTIIFTVGVSEIVEYYLKKNIKEY